MDILSRLPGCAGQVTDAVTACILVKMEDDPKLPKLPKSECPDIWTRQPRHKWPKSSSSMEDPVVPLERNLYGHPLAGLLWEKQFEKIVSKNGWEKIPNWECLFVYREKGLFLSVYVDDIKLVGKKQNLDPMWKVLNKEVDLGEPTKFLDHVYQGCTSKTMWIKHRYCWQLQNHVWITNFRGSNWKMTILWESSYFFVVLRYGRSCQEMCGTILWVGKQDDSTTLQSINSMHWRPSFQRRRVEFRERIVKSMLSNCSEMLVLGTYWTTDILWSVNKFARSITKWTKASDKRLSRLISYIKGKKEVAQSNGCYCKNARLWRTSSWCSICLHSSGIGGRSEISQNSWVRMSRRMDTSSTTQMAEIFGRHARSSGASWTKFISTSINRIVVGKTIRGSSVGTWIGKKYQIVNVSSFIEKKGYFCQYTSMTSKWLERSRIWLPCGKYDGKSGHWRTHIISWPRIFGMYLAWMQTNWNDYWTKYEDVWITYFCWSNWKITGVGRASRRNRSMVLRHGGTCSTMRWDIASLHTSEVALQSVKSLLGWPSI